MTFHRDPTHYLKPLQTTTTPKRLLWLDCAAHVRQEHGASVARYHVAALGTTHYTSKRNVRKDTMHTYGGPENLWGAADQFCTKGKRVVLFAYDLAQQIRVSQAMVMLPRLGWELQNIVLERTAAWALYRSFDRTLMLCDLRSWTTADLPDLYKDVQANPDQVLQIMAGPTWAAERAIVRATIVRDAVLQILNWIEGENLGPFRPTGSGQSYAAYRRRLSQGSLLVHDDTIRLAAERAAMHTGRCEAWRHGHLVTGPFVEYDMQAAYCTIGRDCEVPTIAQSRIRNPTAKTVERAMERYSVLAQVTVRTVVPCLPYRLGGRTVWPDGEFTTWLWDPELRLALDNCDIVKVHHAYRYQRGPALRDFCQYVLDGMAGQTQVYGLVPRRVLKHWSRAMIGRLGLRYRSWERFLTGAEPNLQLVTVIDDDGGPNTDMLWAGRDWLVLSDIGEAIDSLPQIPSWIMSECRRRLWETMLSTGLDNVVYVDTDSLIVNGATVPGLWHTPTVASLYTWHRKGVYRQMNIHGPRNYSTDMDRKVAGVPRTARQTAPLEFTGEVLRSIKESMRAGELDCVTSIPRTFHMNAPDLRRKHLPHGRTQAYTIRPTPPQED